MHLENVDNIKLPASVEGSYTRHLQKVYQVLFGTSSSMCKIFEDQLELSKDAYLEFMITFFKSCRYQMSVKNLHHSNDTIKGLMTNRKYNALWKQIEKLPRQANPNFGYF